MSNNQDVIKNQHYVPQLYLRRFRNKDNLIEVFSNKEERLLKPKSTKSICSEDFYYSPNYTNDEIGQEIERKLSELENYFGQKYEFMLNKIKSNQQLIQDDKYFLAHFIAFQYLRGDYIRRQIQKMNEHFTKEMYKMDAKSGNLEKRIRKNLNVSEEEIEDLVELAKSGKYNIKISNTQHLRMLGEIEEFMHMLAFKKWNIYISRCSKKFITSDNPVVEYLEEEIGFFNNHFFNRKHQIALSPDVLIIIESPENTRKDMKRANLFPSEENYYKIVKFNLNCAKYSFKYIFSSSKEDFKFLLEAIQKSRDEHDYLFKQIIKNIVNQ